jgi:hypothetical protein
MQLPKCLCLIDGVRYALLDVIEHEGELWLVPWWLEERGAGKMRPGRIIRMAALDPVELNGPQARWGTLRPIPKAAAEPGPLPPELAQLCEEEPDLWSPIPAALH